MEYLNCRKYGQWSRKAVDSCKGRDRRGKDWYWKPFPTSSCYTVRIFFCREEFRNCMLSNVISLKYNVLIFKKYLDFSCKNVHFLKSPLWIRFFEGFLSGFFGGFFLLPTLAKILIYCWFWKFLTLFFCLLAKHI